MLVPPSMPLAQGQGLGPYSGTELERLKGWLESPQKLLRLVAGAAAAPAGPPHPDAGETPPQEEEGLNPGRPPPPPARSPATPSNPACKKKTSSPWCGCWPTSPWSAAR